MTPLEAGPQGHFQTQRYVEVRTCLLLAATSQTLYMPQHTVSARQNALKQFGTSYMGNLQRDRCSCLPGSEGPWSRNGLASADLWAHCRRDKVCQSLRSKTEKEVRGEGQREELNYKTRLSKVPQNLLKSFARA